MGGTNLKQAIQSIINSKEEVEAVMPFWKQVGVYDTEVWIHSLGISFWTLLGKKLDFTPVIEVPSPREGRYADAGADIRSDFVWFRKSNNTPILIGEFERYSGIRDEEKILNKVKNLLLSHHKWQEKSEVLVLAYWTKQLVNLPQHKNLKRVIEVGFETNAKERVFGSSNILLLIYQFILYEDHQNRLHLTQIVER